MQSIGIDAVGIGAAAAVFLVFSLVFDIPAGILADKWSRKGTLAISAVALAVASVILGASHSLPLYMVGEIFYGLYFVCTSGTYHAMVYDILHEEGRTKEYSKVAGRAYALFLVGAGVANAAAGFIAGQFSFRTTFYITIVSCAVNILVIASIHEPKFHKAEKKERMLKQLKQASSAIFTVKLLQILAVVMTALAVGDLFVSEFGQLYMLRYVSTPQLIGLVWSVYAFAWAFGSFIAHHFRARLDILMVCAALPLVAMSFIDNWFGLVLLVVQVVAAAAMVNQIETRVQENTPSAVRTSVLSVLSAAGTAISIPASFMLGWLIREYNALWAVRFIAIIISLALLYWLWSTRNIPKSNEPVLATSA